MNKKQLVIGVALTTLISIPILAQTPTYSWTNLPKIAQPVFRKDTLTILSYGAKPNGVMLNTKPIILVDNSCNLMFDAIHYDAKTRLLFSITGERSQAVRVTNTTMVNAHAKAEFSKGATEKSLTLPSSK